MPSDELNFEFHVPAGREKFRVWEVAIILHCSDDHVLELIEAGELGDVADIRMKGAARACYVVTRKGLIDFINRRKR